MKLGDSSTCRIREKIVLPGTLGHLPPTSNWILFVPLEMPWHSAISSAFIHFSPFVMFHSVLNGIIWSGLLANNWTIICQLFGPSLALSKTAKSLEIGKEMNGFLIRPKLAHALCPIPSTILAEFGHQNEGNGETMEEATVSAMANQLALCKLPGIMGNRELEDERI
jgi:hypothetical protein